MGSVARLVPHDKRRHNRSQCSICLRRKILAYQKRLEAMEGALPPSPEHLVPVRRYEVPPHFRRVAGFGKSDPQFRQAAESLLHSLLIGVVRGMSGGKR